MQNKTNLSSYFFGLLITVVCFTQCTPPAATDANTDAEPAPYEVSANGEANLAIVQKYIDALIAADAEGLRSVVADNYITTGPSAEDSSNIDQVIETWTDISTQRTDQDMGIFANTTLTVNSGDFAGEWVNLWGNYTAKMNEGGLELVVPWHGVYLIQNGKIQLSQAWFDNLVPAIQTGLVAPVEQE